MQRQRIVRSGIFRYAVISLLLLTTGQAQAASGNGPYYAEPAWSQKLPAATRFVVLTDWNSEAVLDRNTGLVWERSPRTMDNVDWLAARFGCLNRTTGDQKGWRLPTIAELASLIDPAGLGPTLPSGHPFTIVPSTVQPDYYWSASTVADNTTFAWIVNFDNGQVIGFNKAGSGFYWCVRGGMSADVY